jgi:hypothetical protein
MAVKGEIFLARAAGEIHYLEITRRGSGMSIDDYFNNNQAAEFTKLSVSTLNKLRLTGGGPRYMKLGRRVVYARSTLADWMHRRERASTSALGEHSI